MRVSFQTIAAHFYGLGEFSVGDVADKFYPDSRTSAKTALFKMAKRGLAIPCGSKGIYKIPPVIPDDNRKGRPGPRAKQPSRSTMRPMSGGHIALVKEVGSGVMKELAEACGIHRTVLSKALSGQPVSPATEGKIMSVARSWKENPSHVPASVEAKRKVQAVRGGVESGPARPGEAPPRRDQRRGAPGGGEGVSGGSPAPRRSPGKPRAARQVWSRKATGPEGMAKREEILRAIASFPSPLTSAEIVVALGKSKKELAGYVRHIHFLAEEGKIAAASGAGGARAWRLSTAMEYTVVANGVTINVSVSERASDAGGTHKYVTLSTEGLVARWHHLIGQKSVDEIIALGSTRILDMLKEKAL